MMRIGRFGFFFGWMVTVACAQTAAAYCLSTTNDEPTAGCGRGTPTLWSTPCLSYSVVAAPAAPFDSIELTKITEEAFATWLAARCEMGVPGLEVMATPAIECVAFGFKVDGANANSIAYVSDWSERQLPGEAAALTFNWFDRQTGQMLDTDVLINGTDEHHFAVCSDQGCAVDERDLESTLVHELGHFFGFDHSDVPGSLMHVDYVNASHEGVQRTLSLDDVAAMCQTYPPSASRCEAADAEPINGLAVDSCPPPAGRCSAAVKSDVASVPQWSFGILALLWLGRRVKR